MSLSKLPRELVLTLADTLPVASLNSLLRTCRSLHQLLSPELTTRITTESLASTILQRGIRLKHLPTVHLALDHNAEWHTFTTTSDHCYSALEQACDTHQLDIVAALLTHFGLGIHNTLTEDGSYCHEDPLEMAIRHNELELTTLLLEHGAPPNGTVWYGYPSSGKHPLDFAGKYASSQIAEVLIEHGADVGGANRALLYAVNHGRWGVAEVLLRNGVSVWTDAFPWTKQCPLGERTPEQIKAWVAGGVAYIRQQQEEEFARMIARRDKKKLAEKAAAAREAGTGSEL